MQVSQEIRRPGVRPSDVHNLEDIDIAKCSENEEFLNVLRNRPT